MSPGTSPDLMPVENAFARVKQLLESRPTKTLAQLRAEVRRAWNSLPDSYLATLSNSMPDRIHDTIRSGGNPIGYWMFFCWNTIFAQKLIFFYNVKRTFHIQGILPLLLFIDTFGMLYITPSMSTTIWVSELLVKYFQLVSDCRQLTKIVLPLDGDVAVTPFFWTNQKEAKWARFGQSLKQIDSFCAADILSCIQLTALTF